MIRMKRWPSICIGNGLFAINEGGRFFTLHAEFGAKDVGNYEGSYWFRIYFFGHVWCNHGGKFKHIFRPFIWWEPKRSTGEN
jgi:hypothetical protein